MVRSRLRVVIATENLKRAEAGRPALTQQQIADETGLPLSVVNGLATNRAGRVDFKTLDKLCKYFKVPPGDLLEYVPEAPEVEAAA
jgi:DNA-binding Xre family transcriptional regulator